jgi:succinyl-CoA synthetase alpha subunit
MNYIENQITKKTKVIVQGITGKQGSYHTKIMKKYGTNIVGGVTPGKNGENVERIKVYGSVQELLKEKEAEWSINFVPAPHAKNAINEATKNGLNSIVITEGIPINDMIEVIHNAELKGVNIIGPNCPGIIKPKEFKIGIMPEKPFKKGNIGLVSRSGTLTYEIVETIKQQKKGISLGVGIGGDPIKGIGFKEMMEFFEQDKNTKKIIMVGEIGGREEEQAADYIKENMKKEVIAYIAGKKAKPGKRMGHAGAIIEGKEDTAQKKIKYLEKKGISVATIPQEIQKLI